MTAVFPGPVCGCEQGMGHMDRACHSYGLCHAQSAERTAAPGPRFRDQLARWLFDRDYRERGLCSPEDADWDEWVERNQDEWRDEADELLAFVAAHVQAEVQAATKAARRAQATWDRGRAEEYAAVVGVELTASDDFMDAVNELYLAGQAATNQRAAEAGGPLRCTWCGGGLVIYSETVGPAYLTYETPESVQCRECDAIWEPDGTPRDPAKWVQWPGLYSPPALAQSGEQEQGR